MGYATGSNKYIREEAGESRDTLTTQTTFAKRGYLTLKCDPDIFWSKSDKPLHEQIVAIFQIMTFSEFDVDLAPKGTVLQ